MRQQTDFEIRAVQNERRPVSALNGRATAPVNARCTAIPRLRGRAECRVRVVFRRASSRFAAYRTAPRVPRAPFLSVLPHDPAREPCGRRVAPSAVLRERSTSAEHSCGYRNGQVETSSVPNGRGHLDLLREFEAYCSSPASPDPQVVVFDPEMDLEYTLPRESKNGQRTLARQRARPLTLNPTRISDSPDNSGFTTVRRRRAAKGKPKAGLTQTSDGSMCYRLTPAPRKPKKANVAKATLSGKSTSSIYASPISWRTPSQPAAAPQGAVDDGGVKAAAPAGEKTTEVTRLTSPLPPTPHRVARNHHLCSFRTRIGGPSCAEGARKKAYNSRKHVIPLRD
ncbi:hypothetical protein EVAR_24908_1 [Eumeta japonica]|uniref:Uncharacterized protein n=1 Tax=Eumeta variegata TaxID=151549 RepID=A0A4C1V7K5_EUMVA|nr:hypothetical protein EVAR_24908_1 [Eumeta japonica]